ncbi:hypothetical protein [Kitasatospora sp. GP82]|uniref:hypothetical protein n=1 Tax=Kitasatospora sp. GP82 TaxID=3035089 RepID=UPI002475BF52|nr:hypothetical protein [Kitasatospora sp. GP82]MDH6130070.1 hypothetical protein [Kitasatospora sp. GP82]
MAHELTPLDDAPAGREVRIGWDGPLSTYFLQVLDEPAADSYEEVIETVWEGGVPHEHADPEHLVALASQYAHVPADLADTLRKDKQASGSQFAGRVGTQFVGEMNLPTVSDADQFARIITDMDATGRN